MATLQSPSLLREGSHKNYEIIWTLSKKGVSGAATLFIKIKYGHVLIVPWGQGWGGLRVLDNVHNFVGFFCMASLVG